MDTFFAALSQHAFLQTAVATALLASIGCGVMGTYVVVKRIAFLAGGIAHSVLGGMGAAVYFGLDPLHGALPVAAALLIGWVLWHKGATSGLAQRVVEMRFDDDQDAVWLRVALAAGTHSAPSSCHVGYRSCFYRTLELKTGKIGYAETEKTFDPKQVYGDAPNPTVL